MNPEIKKIAQEAWEKICDVEFREQKIAILESACVEATKELRKILNKVESSLIFERQEKERTINKLMQQLAELRATKTKGEPWTVEWLNKQLHGLIEGSKLQKTCDLHNASMDQTDYDNFVRDAMGWRGLS